MLKQISLYTIAMFTLTGCASVALAQAPSAGDMQQRLDQELANTKRSASESVVGTRQGANSAKAEAERKMEETASQHRSQAEGKMTEEIEKAKQKTQAGK